MPGRGITLRINPGFGHGHSQKTNTGGAAIEARHLARAAGRLPRAGREAEPLDHRPAHAHRLRHRSGAPERRSAARWRRRRSAVGSSITSISAGGGLPVPYREGQEYVDIAAYFKLWDATRHRLATQFGHEIALEIEPGRYLVAESGYLISEIRAIKHDGREHVLSARRRLQQSGPADSVRVLSPDGDLPGRWLEQRSGRRRT